MALFLAGFVAPFLMAFLLRIRGTSGCTAWLLACCVVPAGVLFEVFVLPYRGGGASMWPIALVVGGFYGAVAGAVGLVAGAATVHVWNRWQEDA